MNRLKTLLLVLIIYFQYYLWIGKNGIIDYKKVNSYIVIQKIKNKNLKIFNKKILKEIYLLKNKECNTSENFLIEKSLLSCIKKYDKNI